MFTSIIEAARNAALGKVHCQETACPPLVTGRQIAAASTAAAQTGDSCEFGSLKYYALCCVGGTLSCGLTHTMVVPLDLVKCRLQVDSAKYKNLITGFGISIKEEGMRGLAKGWAPTFWGYSAQVRVLDSLRLELPTIALSGLPFNNYRVSYWIGEYFPTR